VLVRGGLREHTAQFSLSGFGRSIGLFPLASFHLGWGHGNTGSIVGDVEEGDGFFERDGAIVLQKGFSLLLGPALDICADAFRHPLDVLGADLDVRIDFQVLGALLEGRVASGAGHHPAQPWRARGLNDIQLFVAGIAGSVAGGALKQGPGIIHRAENGEQFFGLAPFAFLGSAGADAVQQAG